MPPLDPAARARDADFKAQLSQVQREALSRGEHEALAKELEEAAPALAAWVLEQVWDFARASELYLRAGEPVSALRAAIESGDPSLVDQRVSELAELAGEGGAAVARAGAELLSQRRKHEAAARLLAAVESAPEQRAEAWLAAQDPLRAARDFLRAQKPREALDALESLNSLTARSLAARAWWELGDADACARAAQAGLRAMAIEGGSLKPEEQDALTDLRARLAAALRALGHPHAAQVALDLADPAQHSALKAAQERVAKAGGHGRYRVLAAHPTPLAGSAYLGLDRVTHEEIEVHLLLADQMDGGSVDEAQAAAVREFILRATQANATPHPALRRIIRADARDGLLVLPRNSGQTLRSSIRPPGLAHHPERARALVRFIAEGLAHVHALGFAHGGVLPSLLTLDALARPQLGPAGVDQLSGLAATRTGSLDELLTLTAPELRRGAAASPAADVYALGRVWLALLAGTVNAPLNDFEALRGAAPHAADTLEALSQCIAEDPRARPSSHELVESLSRPVRDIRDLRARGPAAAGPSDSGLRSLSDVASDEVLVEAHASWTREDLDGLCVAASPWVQTITGRDDRTLRVSPWPEGVQSLSAASLADLDPRALTRVADALKAKLKSALERFPECVVRSASGENFISLEVLLRHPALP